jgi:hypothetical protein
MTCRRLQATKRAIVRKLHGHTEAALRRHRETDLQTNSDGLNNPHQQGLPTRSLWRRGVGHRKKRTTNMNTIKKILGLVWMFLAPAIIWFLAAQAIQKIAVATSLTKSNVTLQWVIILTIFTPICIGFFIFGYYAFKGEYDQLPVSSKDLE